MSATATAEVLVERDGAVGVATLNRPQALNALSFSVIKALSEALAGFEADPAVRAVVIAGLPRAFAAGADIQELKGVTDSAQALSKLDDHLAKWDMVGELNKPVIAAVSGFALGGGCELAMACDMIVASETAVFGQPEVLIGTMPGAGGTQRLTKKVGLALAMEMCLTGRRLSAREAMSFGLVNRVVPVEACVSEAKKLAAQVAALSPTAVRSIKASVRSAVDAELAAGLQAERRAFYATFDTADQKEGMKAFAEKRKPVWTGK
ncbi:MAG: enoyl-CoA hydratase-related protein [Elusimicrobiota bacterium]|nr:enoyl-CoA hydratase-related protein [Elusimicrobiota bacterium]